MNEFSTHQMAQVASYVPIMITRRCNMTCGHCSVSSSPRITDEPSLESLLGYVRQAAAAGVRQVQLTGGEPMLRERVLLRILRECRGLGLVTYMTTNGFWGRTPFDAKRRLRRLRRAGLHFLTVSYDRYHADFQGYQGAINIARAAEAAAFPINLNLVRGADDAELDRLIADFEEFHYVRLRFYDLQPVGRALMLPSSAFRSHVDGFCSACAAPTITDDGRVIACNGPAYFAPPYSPLIIGSLDQEPLSELLERHWRDPVLETIRTFGPSRLREELRRIPGFDQRANRTTFQGMCDLCHEITSDREAVAALRTYLSTPDRQAERQAVGQLIVFSKKRGILTREYANGVGVTRVLLRAMWDKHRPWTHEAEQVLGRADINWSHLATSLCASGLARSLTPRLNDPDLLQWAPAFFLDRIRQQAPRDTFRETMQRDVLETVGNALEEVGATAILTQGPGALPIPANRDNAPLPRVEESLELVLSPENARKLHGKLVSEGSGRKETEGYGSRHGMDASLSTVLVSGIPVRLRTECAPSYWGIPSRGLLARALPVEGIGTLYRLTPEDALLFTMVQASDRIYAYGLKTVWDARWLLAHASTIDWDRLAQVVRDLSIPRGFWVPIRLLARELEFPIPTRFLAQAPLDTRQRKLETIAWYRLFEAMKTLGGLDPFSRLGVLSLLNDSWVNRFRTTGGMLATMLNSSETRPPLGIPVHAIHRYPRYLRQALLHWRLYRRALARS